jgi:hypothetical protein
VGSITRLVFWETIRDGFETKERGARKRDRAEVKAVAGVVSVEQGDMETGDGKELSQLHHAVQWALRWIWEN